MCVYIWLNSTCVGAVSPNVCDRAGVRACACVRMHSQHAGVRRLVTCTCQNQYLASLGYDNAAVCVPRPPPVHVCTCTHAYAVLRASRARERHNLPDFAEFPRRPCNARRKQCVRSETFPISERRSRVTSRVYWTFLNRRRARRPWPPPMHLVVTIAR